MAPVSSSGVTDEREGTGPAPVQSPLTLYSSLISPGVSLAHTFPTETFTSVNGSERKAYIHVVQTSGYNPSEATGATVTLSGEGTELTLREGDGAYIRGDAGAELKISNVGDRVVEVLLFDVE